MVLAQLVKMMKVLIFSLLLVLTLDIVSNALLFWSEFHTNVQLPFETYQSCFQNFLSCFCNIRQYSVEVLTLMLVRLLFNLMAVIFAVRLGAVDATTTKPVDTTTHNGIQTPLLNVTIAIVNPESKEQSDTHISQDGEVLVRGVLGPEGRKNLSKVAKQKKVLDRKAKANLRKNLCLAAAFFVNTVVSMYIGIKVVLFDFDVHIVLQSFSLGSAPIWINLEFILCRWIVEEWLKVKGVKFAIHHHPLFLKEMPCNWCDLCHQQIRERQGYRCDICDFDVCNACASKKDRSRAEGVLRGDGGVKEEKEITSCQYFCRAMKLTIPHKGTIAIALAALLVNSTAAIWTPNYTGRILDAVVHSKLDVFWDDVKFYSLLCIVTGAFGAVRNLCVSLVGRRIAKDVREQLFSAMMVQDIAFFDGMPTGQLTSRLTNDTNAMVSPLNTILNSLVSNILLLIGGLVMCLYTSWRLSLLAFTSIGPIIYVTSVYARWYVRYFAVWLVVCTNTRVLFFLLLVIHLASLVIHLASRSIGA